MQQMIRQIKNKEREVMCMYEEKTERVRQRSLIFQGNFSTQKVERIEKRLGKEKGEDGEC